MVEVHSSVTSLWFLQIWPILDLLLPVLPFTHGKLHTSQAYPVVFHSSYIDASVSQPYLALNHRHSIALELSRDPITKAGCFPYSPSTGVVPVRNAQKQGYDSNMSNCRLHWICSPAPGSVQVTGSVSLILCTVTLGSHLIPQV